MHIDLFVSLLREMDLGICSFLASASSQPPAKRQKVALSSFGSTAKDEDEFRRSFKLFKSLKRATLQSLKLIDHPVSFPRDVDCADWKFVSHLAAAAAAAADSVSEEAPQLGLKPVSEWTIKESINSPGAYVICNPFTPAGQARWIEEALSKYPPVEDYTSNLDREWSHAERRSKIDWWKNRDGDGDSIEDAPIWKLRWITLGYHHDWNTKMYSNDKRSPFPDTAARLCRVFARVLGFQDYAPQAAIVNYYHLDSTLSAHQDISEPFTEAPLFSISFGQPAIFLIGPDKSQRPYAVVLQGGDVFVMSGKCRLDYHAVPKVFADGAVADLSLDGGSSMFSDEKVRDYLRKSRINFNVRQVLRPGETVLRYD